MKPLLKYALDRGEYPWKWFQMGICSKPGVGVREEQAACGAERGHGAAGLVSLSLVDRWPQGLCQGRSYPSSRTGCVSIRDIVLPWESERLLLCLSCRHQRRVRLHDSATGPHALGLKPSRGSICLPLPPRLGEGGTRHGNRLPKATPTVS